MDSEYLSDRLQSRFSEFLEQNGKRALQWVFLGVALLVALLYFWFGKGDKKSPGALLDASYYYLIHTPLDEIKPELKSFQEALKNNKDLIPNYQGKAAQLLLEKGAVEEALPLILPLFERVRLERFPPFLQFSEISLSISQGDLKEALERSLKLQESLQNDETLALLAAHNLVRIAFLQILLEDNDGFKETALTFKQILYSDTEASSPWKHALEKVESIYSYKNLGLSSYLERTNPLSP